MRSYIEKLKLSVSLMFLLTIIGLLPTLRLLRQKSNLFPSHFASIWSCSKYGHKIWGESAVLYLPDEAKSHLKQQYARKRHRKQYRSQL